MNGLDAVEAIAIDLGCPAKRDAPMREYTSFRTGGPADLLVEPRRKGNWLKFYDAAMRRGFSR